MTPKDRIAARAAKELMDGDIVNLGIGLPTQIPQYLPPDVEITLQSENGFLGLGPLDGTPVQNLVNAGGNPCGISPGAAFFDSAMSFALIRGGHIDVTILGGLQVDQHGNLANWKVPGKMVPGMGGAMDLVTGARKVIVVMEHCAKDGSPKILDRCSLPLTALAKVHRIITELAVFDIQDDKLILQEIAPDLSIESLAQKTGATFVISNTLAEMIQGAST
ncbi:3-oxoacid CoA-transferase subunit B [Fluviibacter phosphoraccumulans]|uniref:Succinyl-CoA--3-ketoacid-CoA transferase n=1 Tax=Fluviibacter phosphoraccumulans TaxID=1751046 RepID=A0A7R6R850_9RHOO|nr:3-oxoacid CoA-transferase subunit B [Fluviibacter phosphoraccumulans]BBU69724.1 succinyl-CoA--3-ketoacid-CoA transferase [Fluviibacter phosphoraccumulans]BBU71093.1 succinyl-CoA--3-ketoacid-CoA transferase [Fluviibacter phosphoraccumulans]